MFQTFFYQPVLNLLVFLYNIVPGNDLGIAIILLTVVIKLLLLPLSKKSIKSQKALQDLQPQTEELKKKFKDNKEAMSKAMLELYKKNKVNPFSSCLPLIVQLPFLFAVFRVF
ncbi:membrane protein insertase YidC, partial [Candidatus Parcubacteria bacterium]|nr:membrane protein insertase YidC [Candidatus Parcubacteria bacterium]